MPDKGDPLSTEQVGLIRAWVDQGAGLARGDRASASARPRSPRGTRPSPPASPARARPPGRPLRRPPPGRARRSRSTGRRSPTATFARRASLDLVGLIPTPEQLAAFEKDAGPTATPGSSRRLLADREAYADHWLTFWNDALRNSYRGTGFIDGGRATITRWLYRSLLREQALRPVRPRAGQPGARARRGSPRGSSGEGWSTPARPRRSRRRRTSRRSSSAPTSSARAATTAS